MSSSGRSRWLAATMLSAGLVASAGVAKPVHKAADARDKRIEALEAQVDRLTKIVTDMRDHPATVAATTPLPAPPAAGQVSATAPAQLASSVPTNGGDASPRATSPDQVRPVTTSVPGPSAGGVTLLAGKPSLQSPDGRFVANLHSVMQFDAASYSQAAAGPIATDLRRAGAVADTARARNLASGTNFRRARIGIDGKVFGDFDYNVLFEFGGAGVEDAGHIQELWLQYTGLKPFRFRVGAFPPSYGLEDQGSTNGSLFLERPAISDITRSVAGGDYREAGQLAASGSRWFANVALTTRVVGVANAAALGSAPSFNQSFGGIARVAVLPLVGDDYLLHLGAHGSRVFKVADNGGPDVAITGRYPVQFRERPELRVDGTRLIDTGTINASHVNTIGAEVAAQKGPVMVQGEVERITVERLASTLSNPHFTGFYVEGGWVLTGERRKYNPGTFAFDAPTVDHPFDFKQGTYGAFELAGRYSVTDLNYDQGKAGVAAPLDGIRGGKQKIIAAGLNWYLNPVIRFMFDYQHVEIDRLSPNATTYLTPVGAQIGQKYNVISLRSQLAF
ncbi:porin [Glacieibacterium megasporae]|uniref:porin n=1 Tax=Glacieibacterium megasporae TaxID=2835787 RepID=UPI001C1E51B1|nr:porin [Polymorphobacter megasporae]UAJ09158.1 hypothetical protein KTC28_12480 [Polymorphobacter megasporae]